MARARPSSSPKPSGGPRGENKRRLLALGQRFERAADGFDQARSALAEGRTQDYLAALDLLAECCPP